MARKQNPSKVLGIDPGADTGIAIVSRGVDTKLTLEFTATVKTDPDQQPSERFRQIFAKVRDVIFEYKPHLITIEQPLPWLRNGVPLLWLLTGGAIAAAEASGYEYRMVNAPTKRRAKKGFKLVGLATKKKAKAACRKMFGKEVANKLNEHKADAAMLAVYGLKLLEKQ